MNAFLSSIIAEESSSGGLGGLILPLLLLGPLMYMMIVPQRKQRKKQAEMLASLAVGDEVITSGGIHGTVNFLDDAVAHVEVDTDVVIRVSKSALTRVAPAVVDVTDDTPAQSADAADSAAGDAGAKSKK